MAKVKPKSKTTGSVGSAASALKKAGFYDAGKKKSERINIINKVTTKPQRMDIVDKLFSAKKTAGSR
jgi:hypothetical protein